ncbi:MAG: RHS repeat-associated core domain-containing protein [Fimbriimonadaceae bacterium]|nr:RHS repeat-associated core domain-containing protein [Fimbriimonadaceae bacterium]
MTLICGQRRRPGRVREPYRPEPPGLEGLATYQSDIIMGNRTWRNYGQSGVQRYVYDVLNRCTSVCGASDGARYEYRPDGLRVEKVSGLSVTWNPADRVHGSGWYDENWTVNKATSRYFYDGQMCMEEDFVPSYGPGEYTKVTRYGLGARGVDYMEQSITGGSPTRTYPLYDGHGNMIATISLEGDLSNLREYDAWGDVRDQAGVTTDPNTRYCANLGHKQDDESGLIYMRARFYDSGTGRFISEDPAMQGTNWFVYCNNDPVSYADSSGTFYIPASNLWAAAGWAFAALAVWQFGKYNPSYIGEVQTFHHLNRANACALIATACFSAASLFASGTDIDGRVLGMIGVSLTAFIGIVSLMTAGASHGSKTAVGAAIFFVYAYGLALLAELIATDVMMELLG